MEKIQLNGSITQGTNNLKTKQVRNSEDFLAPLWNPEGLSRHLMPPVTPQTSRGQCDRSYPKEKTSSQRTESKTNPVRAASTILDSRI